MDLNDIWTQNKRWILGVLAGGVLFWIATSIVGSIWDGGAAERKVLSVASALRKQSYYDAKARKLARTSGEALESAQARLDGELTFTPDELFELAGKGDPDLHFDRVQRDVRTALVDKAQQFSVELAPDGLRWAAPVGREEIERALIGLNVLETAVDRLLDASEEIRSASTFGALGVQAIEKFEVTSKRARRSSGYRRSKVRRDSDSVDVEERVDEYEVSFKFRADAPTVQLFLDNGVQILDHVRSSYPSLPVIMFSGHGTIETAVAAIKKGALDFIEKPFKSDRLLVAVGGLRAYVRRPPDEARQS